MSFKFLHTSDWHLGRKFGSFGDDLNGRLTSARIDTIERLANLATKNGVHHIVVAGDVWDTEQPSNQTIAQSIDLLSEKKSITWWLMPGNHDPRGSNTLWLRIAGKHCPNIKLLLEPKPYQVSDSIWLLPAPLTCKSPDRDLTEWMNDANLPKSATKIGVAHGSVHNFVPPTGNGTATTRQAIIDPKRADLANLDYLALGDAHGTNQVNERVWYSGTPEIDKFHKQDSGNALIVELKPNVLPNVVKHKTTKFNWEILDVQCDLTTTDVPDTHLTSPDFSLRHTLLKVNLQGTTSDEKKSVLLSKVETLSQRLAFTQIKEDKLKIVPTHGQTYQIEHTGIIEATIETLQKTANDKNTIPGDRSVIEANNALKLLHFFLERVQQK